MEVLEKEVPQGVAVDPEEDSKGRPIEEAGKRVATMNVGLPDPKGPIGANGKPGYPGEDGKRGP